MLSMFKYLKGAIFLGLASVVSILNDVCMKCVNMNSYDILFWRFASATLFLIPFMFFFKLKPKKNSLRNHTIRALIFGISMFFYINSLQNLPIATVNAINFSIPIWVVLLAYFFLKEPFNGRFLSTSLGLIGIIVACIPIWQSCDISSSILLVLGAIGFACLDVFNKHLMNKDESMILMLFGSSLGITLLYMPFFSWQFPSNFYIFAWLGIGANAILYFILKAWEACDISALQPLKYIEFPIAIYFGHSLFNETTHPLLFVGLGILIAGVLINARRETILSKDNNKKSELSH
jgi:S-adenosylmethionine uptake transporter